MNLTVKNFSIFAFLYAVSLFITNLVAVLVAYFDAFYSQLFPIIIGGYYSYLCLPFPTVGRYVSAFPMPMETKFNLLGITLSLLIFIISYYLVFQKKVRLWKWFIIFTIINLVVATYFKLERGFPAWRIIYFLITGKPISID